MLDQRGAIRQPRQRIVPREETRAFLRDFMVTPFRRRDAFEQGVVRGDQLTQFITTA